MTGGKEHRCIRGSHAPLSTPGPHIRLERKRGQSDSKVVPTRLLGCVYTQTWTQHSHVEESIPATQNWHRFPVLGEKAQPREPGDVTKRIEGDKEGQEKEENKEMKERKGDEEACEGGKTEGALTQP